jgi:hypothetical protein
MLNRLFILLIGIAFVGCSSSYAQKIQLIFGSGFDNDTCMVIVDNGFKMDTVLIDKVLTTKESMGVATQFLIEYPRTNKTTSIEITVNNRVRGSYSFDVLKSTSELLVEFNRDVIARHIQLRGNDGFSDYKSKREYEFLEFNLRQNGGFKFY